MEYADREPVLFAMCAIRRETRPGCRVANSEACSRAAQFALGAPPPSMAGMPDGLIHFQRHAKIVMPVHEGADARRAIRRNRCRGEPRVIQSSPCSVFRPGAVMDR